MCNSVLYTEVIRKTLLIHLNQTYILHEATFTSEVAFLEKGSVWTAPFYLGEQIHPEKSKQILHTHTQTRTQRKKWQIYKKQRWIFITSDRL